MTLKIMHVERQTLILYFQQLTYISIELAQILAYQLSNEFLILFKLFRFGHEDQNVWANSGLRKRTSSGGGSWTGGKRRGWHLYCL